MRMEVICAQGNLGRDRNGDSARLCRPMSGRAMPLPERLKRFWRLGLLVLSGAVGKAKPFRSSGGKAAKSSPCGLFGNDG